ncbi:MAG: hypothetical protein HY820_44030 [Acidobacteria bacterium]|nr:hypothetical protein [Acidobacteriota bacterium]
MTFTKASFSMAEVVDTDVPGGHHFGDSDDLQSWGYFNRAREVYKLLGIPERIEFVLTDDGHKANGPEIDPAWRAFFERWLKREARW